MASYAGLAPVTRRSGSSIRGEHPPRGGNKTLKIAQGKRHNEALIALARRRTDVLYAMLRDHKPYLAPVPAAV